MSAAALSSFAPLVETLIRYGWAREPSGSLRLVDAALFRQSRVRLVRELARQGIFPTQAGFQQFLASGQVPSDPGRWFEARQYLIRPPAELDLPALLRLEVECWPAPLQATAAELRQRLDVYTEGSHVLELDGQVVGVIYTQRIAAVAALFHTDFRHVWALHLADGPVVQPLAVNVLPAMQQHGFGDQLLEYVLQLATLQPDVQRVAGVTRCQLYEQYSALPMHEYVELRNAHGLLVDPILRFHASHGATVQGVIADYRPPDHANRSMGVLVEYDLQHRLQIPAEQHPMVLAGSVQKTVEDLIRSLLPDDRREQFAADRALRELGFDSFRLTDLRVLLSQRLGVPIEPTIFFRYGTATALAAYLEHGGPTPSGADAHPHHFPAEDAAVPPVTAAAGAAAATSSERATEPIAIVAMACRFPGGVQSPESFWSLLHHGQDAISELPGERRTLAAGWEQSLRQAGIHYGGFLERLDYFDAAFFRIAPVEAAAMDPQQRLLLETHWEALERAGIDPTCLRGSDTGIFVGISQEDYKLLQAQSQSPLDMYFGSGTSNSIAAGRLAYVLGTEGPTMAIDTACSSSLVAVHQACQSLRSGESQLALASGVNVLLAPELSIAFAKAGMLAADGRCKTFDERADGYVRSEGCGVVVLKRLADAEASGDAILAVIRGSAINQDGASNGLTAPNGLAQEALIRKALAQAALDPQSIGYVEAHGTGTPLGDPLEVHALQAVYGAGRRPDEPLVVGSVKTNIGHTESAAGIAGLIKTVLALQHERIPAHLHFRRLHPHLNGSAFVVPHEGRDWPRGTAPRRAAVSSFGFSGTNAHVIVEEAPLPKVTRRRDRPFHLLTLSARSAPALRELASRYAAALPHFADDALPAIARTTQLGRAHFAHRLAVVASSVEGAAASLTACAAGSAVEGLAQGCVRDGRPAARMAFLFTGQGAQYLGMARSLYLTQPLFRQRLDQCDVVLQECLGRSLLELLYPATPPEHDDLMTSHPCGQAVTFAIECALSDLWRSWGVEPDLVLGHSLGDFAAAYTAGVISLSDGLRVVTERGRLMETAAGRMVAVKASEADLTALLADLADVTIGVINGPRSVVVSGGLRGMAIALERLRSAGFETRELMIPVAAHSPMLDPVLPAFEAVVAAVRLSAPTLPVVSSMTGESITDELTSPAYWRRHLRRPVRFAAGVATLHARGCTIFLEIGPHGTLLGLAEQVLEQRAHVADPPTLLPSLDRGRDSWQQISASLGELYVRGVPIRWSAVASPKAASGSPVVLPTYPFQRERYWFESGSKKMSSAEAADGLAGWRAGHDAAQLSTLLRSRGRIGAVDEPTLRRLLAALEAEHQAQQQATRFKALLWEVNWEPQSHRSVGVNPLHGAGRWLVLGDAEGLGSALARQLQAAGQQVTLLLRTALAAPDDPDALAARLTPLLTAAEPWQGLVFLWGLDGAQSPEQNAAGMLAEPSLGCGALLAVLQAGLRSTLGDVGIPIWVVTRGAQDVGEGPLVAPAQAPLWGLGRTLSLEQPKWWGGLLDLTPAACTVDECASTIVQELMADPGEEQVAWRSGQRFVARLRPARQIIDARPLTIRPDGLYLITGGLGGLGLHAARWLAQRGARRLVLTGRRGVQSAEQQQALRQLAAQGVEVQVVPVDVADEDGMTRLFTSFAGELRGVIHAAGVASFVPLDQLSRADLLAMLRPKVLGGLLLHRLTCNEALDFFVCYASGAGIWGGRTQAHYGAANHFLDALAAYRRGRGLPGLSIAWGLWDGAGVVSPAERSKLLAMGQRAMSPGVGMAILEHALRTGATCITAADVDWSQMQSLYQLTRARRFLDRVTGAAPGTTSADGATAAPGDAPAPLVRELEGLPFGQRPEHLRRHLQTLVAQVLRMREPPAADTKFRDLGMDSLMALELRRGLERTLRRRLPATIALEYGSIDALAQHLLDEVLGLAPPPTVPRVAARPGERSDPTHHAPIAVVSLGCRFPGAPSPEAFWDVLGRGLNLARETPASRWNSDDFYDPQPQTPGRLYNRAAAYVDGVESFDPLFFGISPREAASMDPQHWLLLEVAWEALERVGLAGRTLNRSRTGIFVGIGTESFGNLSHSELSRLDAYAITSGHHNAAAGRLAYLLGLHGPVMVVDSACSSSLVAVHLACQSLRSGECDLALAGGVSLMLSPRTSVVLSQMQVLAPDGRCKTFDAAADGYGRGEGCGVVVLKRLADAQADGDDILAVIPGSAVNHDGPSSGLMVPNRQAHERLIREVLASAQLPPDAVDYVEAHGTGTALGDPIEVRALANVFGPTRPRPLRLGTTKTNIGHLEAASGVAGLIKTVLSVHHGQLPAHVNFTQAHPHLEGIGTLFAIPTALSSWPRADTTERRVAGVSAFGLSGTNAHVIVESAAQVANARAIASAANARPSQVLVLSARSEEALRALAERYQHHLQRHPDVALGDLCYTAAVGRRHFEVRAALPVASAAALRTELHALRQGAAGARLQRGQTSPRAPRLAFLFNDDDELYTSIARELYALEPVFRNSIDRCAAVLGEILDFDLVKFLYADPPTSDASGHADTAAFSQSARFAVAVALARLWQSWGVQPEVLIGYGVGELAAACIAEVFDLNDGLRLVVARSRLLGAPQPDDVGVAAFRKVAEAITYHLPKTQLFAAASDGESDAPITTPDYWVRHATSVASVAVNHARIGAVGEIVLTMGSQPRSLQQTMPSNNPDSLPVVLPSLRRHHDWQQLLESLAALYVRGVEINWAAFYAGAGHRRVLQPTYPFQRQLYWTPERARTACRGLRPKDVLPVPTSAVASDETSLVEQLRNGQGDELQKSLLAMGQLDPLARQALPRIVASMVALQQRQKIETTVADWLYRPTWHRAEAPSRRADSLAPASPWVIFADAGGVGEALAAELARQGVRVSVVWAERGYRVLGAERFTIEATAQGDYRRLFDGLPALAGIVYLWGLDAPTLAVPTAELMRAARDNYGSVLELVQALDGRPQPTQGVWLITRDALAAAPGDSVTGAAQAPLWGLGRVIALEHPELACVCVDLSATDAQRVQATALAAELLRLPAPTREDRLALRGGNRYVARLERLVPRPDPSAAPIRASATYLITGGLGGLGLRAATWLVERGARHLVLMGRSAPTPTVAERLHQLAETGAMVTVAQCDVGDPARVAAVLAAIPAMLPLAGIIHAATTRDGGDLLLEQRWSRFEAMLRPKLAGAHVLHAATQGSALDFFVCFSSMTTVFGDIGLGPYVAANAFLDALAEHRQAQGQAAQSIAWGIWSEIGAAVDMKDEELANMTRQGHGRIAPDQGLAALARLLGEPVAQVCVAPVDWRAFGSGAPGGTRPFFASLCPAGEAPGHTPADVQATTPTGPVGLGITRQQFAQLRPGERVAALSRELTALVRRVLGLPAAVALEPGQSLLALGLDSLMAIELRNALRRAWGVDIALARFLQGFSVGEMVDRLRRDFDSNADLAAAVREPTPATPAADWEVGEL